MSAHDTEGNITTPIQDNVTETVRGFTESDESVTPEQLYLSEAFMPNERRVDTEANIRDLPMEER